MSTSSLIQPTRMVDIDESVFSIFRKESDRTLQTANETDDEQSECSDDAYSFYEEEITDEEYIMHVVGFERQVRFGEMVAMVEIESCSTFTAEEKSNSWYSPQELQDMSKEMRQKAAQFADGQVQENEDETSRGLEAWGKEGYGKLRRQVKRVWDAVLDEQDEQWDSDCCDEERIASISQIVTCVSAQKALRVAQLDHEQAD